MTEINPTGPNPNKPTQGQDHGYFIPPDKKADNPFEPTKGWDAYKDWLGEKGYKKFQEMLCQNISHEIGQEKIKEQTRKEVMKKSIEGDTDIFSP